MGKVLRLGIKPLSLSGRAAELGRRLLGLPASGDSLKVVNCVPLTVEVAEEVYQASDAFYGSAQRERKIDTRFLIGEALIDQYHTDPVKGEMYKHTEANPLFWTPARILYAWTVASIDAEQSIPAGDVPEIIADLVRMGGK